MSTYASGSLGEFMTARSKAFRTPAGSLACENISAMRTCGGGKSGFFLTASPNNFKEPSKSRSLNLATASATSFDSAEVGGAGTAVSLPAVDPPLTSTRPGSAPEAFITVLLPAPAASSAQPCQRTTNTPVTIILASDRFIGSLLPRIFYY